MPGHSQWSRGLPTVPVPCQPLSAPQSRARAVLFRLHRALLLAPWCTAWGKGFGSGCLGWAMGVPPTPLLPGREELVQGPTPAPGTVQGQVSQLPVPPRRWSRFAHGQNQHHQVWNSQARLNTEQGNEERSWQEQRDQTLLGKEKQAGTPHCPASADITLRSGACSPKQPCPGSKGSHHGEAPSREQNA